MYLLLGHRPAIVKGAAFGSKVGGSSLQYLSCKVFCDWSMINIWEINLIIRRVYISCTF